MCSSVEVSVCALQSFSRYFELVQAGLALYILTLVSNRCINFIAMLSTSKLLITSKHSIGPVQSASESHTEVGEHWFYRHLEWAGKTMEQLAETLYAKNWTIATEVRRISNP